MLKVPSRMSQWMTPSLRDSAGSTEYLEKNELVLMISHLAWPDLPLATTKKAFLVAFQPYMAQAHPW